MDDDEIICRNLKILSNKVSFSFFSAKLFHSYSNLSKNFKRIKFLLQANLTKTNVEKIKGNYKNSFVAKFIGLL